MIAPVVTSSFKWTGNMRFVGQILHRAEPAEVEKAVLSPWRGWVLGFRIPSMFARRGEIPGEQKAWAPLSEWTYSQKGAAKSLLMISARGNAPGTLLGSYAIDWSRGAKTWTIVLSNAARSASKWSPGFDYPSALHRGWDGYTVKPRTDGPGYLAIPFLGSWRKVKTTGELQFHAGKGKRKGKGKAATTTFDSYVMFRKETHPTGAPARPHLLFYRLDALELCDRAVKWALQAIGATGTQGV